MLGASVMGHDYDRRRASKAMSPWLMKMLDKIAQAHKARIDGSAKASGGDLYAAEELVRKHPSASDDELAKLALANFEIGWAEIIEDHASREIITKWVDHIISQTSATPDAHVRVDVKGDLLVVETTAWGTTFEYDDDQDGWNSRVEVPALDDMHNIHIRDKFKQTGAVEAHSEWKLVDDPNGYQADALTFPTTIKWHIDEKALSQKHGAAAFEHAFKAVLPDARKEVAANPTTHTPAAPPKARGRRR